MDDIRRYYEILDLDPGASSEEVSRAYRDLVNVWHPDRFSKTPRLREKAEIKLKEINEAYEAIRSYLSGKGQSVGGSAVRAGSGWRYPFRRIVHEGREKKSRNLARTYPVTRALARFLDYLMFGFLLIYLDIHSFLLRLDIPVPLFPIIVTFVWVFLEAGFLSALGTTPGKWLLKTSVIDSSLKKPGYFSALRRSLSVWCNGMGTGIFFVFPVTGVISYQRLKKDGYAQWDREGRFYLIHGKVSAARFVAAFLLFAVFSLLNMGEIRKRLNAAPAQETAGQEETTIRSGEKDTGVVDGAVRGPGFGGEAADHAEAEYRLGKAFYEHGRYENAVEILKKVVRARPEFAEALYGLGISYANLRMYEKAKEMLRRAIDLRPRYAEAHQILGIVYLDTGEREAAIREQEILRGLDKGLADELLAYIEIPAGPERAPNQNMAPDLWP